MKMELKVNGKLKNIDVDPMRRLLDVLREDFGLIGTKEGCGEGECGACTVLLEGKPVTSCTVNVCNAENKEVMTPEYLGTLPLGKIITGAFDETNAVQCGFCFPGFLVSSYYYIINNGEASRKKISEALSGNICRCTGYTKVIDSVLIAIERYKENN